MSFNIREYSRILEENHIHVIYSGPIWANGIDWLAETILKRFESEDVPLSSSQAVFSIFVEQINNMMMYSADKGPKDGAEGDFKEISRGVFLIGFQDSAYYIQSGNVVTDSSAAILKSRIDHLNTLDKKELRQFYKQRLMSKNDNPESKGAGIGLIEIARRASAPIAYELEPYGEGLQYFTMRLTVAARKEGI